MIHPTALVHPSTDIEDDVAVGARTTIWQRAQVRTGARIGGDGVVGRDVFIDAGVVIGNAVKIQNAALLYHGVTVEDGVFIGPGAILTNDRYPRSITASGELARSGDWRVSPIVLRHGCAVGAGAVVVAGVEVGRFATVGAGAVVTHDVPAHALVAGNPARRIGWVCSCGRPLVDANGDPAPAEPAHYARDTALHCPACGRAFSYVPDGQTVEEASGPRTEIPA